MLVLTRLKEEAIMIGDDIEVKVLDIRGERVRLGIVAPPSVVVHRKEVYLAIRRENAGTSGDEPKDLGGAKLHGNDVERGSRGGEGTDGTHEPEGGSGA